MRRQEIRLRPRLLPERPPVFWNAYAWQRSQTLPDLPSALDFGLSM